MRRLFFCLLLAVMALGLITCSASRNTTSPWVSSDPVGEPIGVFQQLSLIQEKLTLDMRSLLAHRKGRVIATYLIRNNGSQATVDLLFISPGIQEGSVTIDGNQVKSQTISRPTLSPEWKKAITMPMIGNKLRDSGFGGTQNLYNLYQNHKSVISFQATLPKGEHRLQVSYNLQPYEDNSEGKIYRQYLIGYFLAPARSWAKFGQMNIEVNLPVSWEVATSLPMQRTKDTLRATFTGIPADGLTIVTSPPLNPFNYGFSFLLRVAGWGIGLSGSWWVGLAAGSSARRRGLGWCLGVCITTVLMPMGGLIFILPTLLGEWLSWSLLDNGHLSPIWQQGHNIILLLLLFLGFWISGVTTAIAMTQQLYPSNSKSRDA